MARDYHVIKQIDSDDSRMFAVVSFGEAYEGKWKRKCLWVSDWYHKEDDARASAHRMNHPEG